VINMNMNLLEESDFIRLTTFIQKNYGINLTKKKQLIEARLNSTLQSMGFKNFNEYINHILRKSDPKDIEIMLNKLTTNYTFFMRETSHFDFLKNTILPQMVKEKKNRVLNIWSAGCSTGQEPYTISIILKEFFKTQYPLWDIKILATDISQNALSQAKLGIYLKDSLKDVPESWLRRYFIKSPGKDEYQVSNELKSSVSYKIFNLMDPIIFRVPFDIIFCRNVMIYFNQETKENLVQKFYDATNTGGYLLIGHSETINRSVSKYKYIMPATYRKI
jgi:chemotaxis protein methyltransferase CheR